jgi:hypothetical protein
MKIKLSEPMGCNKALLRGKCIAMSAFIKNTERSKINDLMLHLKLKLNPKQTDGEK